MANLNLQHTQRRLNGELTPEPVSQVPVDRPSEERFIACCLTGGSESTAEGLELLRVDQLHETDCRRAFGVLATMAANSQDISVPTFLVAWRELYNDGSENLFFKVMVEVLNVIPSPAMIGHYASEIIETAKRRRLFFSAHGILGSLNDRTKDVDEILAAAETELMGQEIGSIPYFNSLGCAHALMTDLTTRLERQGQPTGIITGYSDLDSKTDGLQAGEQTILAARPGAGKTAIGLCIAHRACLLDGIPTLFVSLEMCKEALLRRLVAIHSAVPMFVLRKGTFMEDHFPKIATFTQVLHNSPFHVLDAVGGADDQELGAAIRRKIRQHGIKLVIVDYLQKIRASQRNEKRTYEVAQVSSTLKAITSRCNVAMLTLAQLNRESEKTKGQMPRLVDLADSGQIERDADVVLLLHRDRDNPDSEASLILAKNRDGETGVTHLVFDGRHCKFSNKSKIADEDVPPPLPHHSEPAEQHEAQDPELFHVEQAPENALLI